MLNNLTTVPVSVIMLCLLNQYYSYINVSVAFYCCRYLGLSSSILYILLASFIYISVSYSVRSSCFYCFCLVRTMKTKNKISVSWSPKKCPIISFVMVHFPAHPIGFLNSLLSLKVDIFSAHMGALHPSTN